MRNKNRELGFSLIEILIVLAIIGIISAFAIPSYQNSRLKSNRSDGIAALNEIMQAEERYNAANETYTLDLTAIGYAATQPSQAGYYRVTAANCTNGANIAVCVNLIATAQAGQANDANGNGGNLTLNSQGVKVGW